MALLERVSTLVRANLNDLIDKAEHPEKMIKQVILDMQNQFIQVKTQVAIAIADLHLLEKKRTENEQTHADWMRKAELAVEKKQDDLARAALQRALSYKQMTENFTQQIEDQRTQVELLKNALRSLEQKVAEAQSKSELMIAQHRRSRAVGKAADAQAEANGTATSSGFERMKGKINREEALSQAKVELLGTDAEDRLASMERDEQIDKLLAEIKGRKSLTA
jgi:phage shock protein A